MRKRPQVRATPRLRAAAGAAAWAWRWCSPGCGTSGTRREADLRSTQRAGGPRHSREAAVKATNDLIDVPSRYRHKRPQVSGTGPRPALRDCENRSLGEAFDQSARSLLKLPASLFRSALATLRTKARPIARLTTAEPDHASAHSGAVSQFLGERRQGLLASLVVCRRGILGRLRSRCQLNSFDESHRFLPSPKATSSMADR